MRSGCLLTGRWTAREAPVRTKAPSPIQADIAAILGVLLGALLATAGYLLWGVMIGTVPPIACLLYVSRVERPYLLVLPLRIPWLSFALVVLVLFLLKAPAAVWFFLFGAVFFNELVGGLRHKVYTKTNPQRSPLA